MIYQNFKPSIFLWCTNILTVLFFMNQVLAHSFCHYYKVLQNSQTYIKSYSIIFFLNLKLLIFWLLSIKKKKLIVANAPIFLTESGHLLTWAKYEVFLIITIVPHTYISDYFRSVKPHSGADCKLFSFCVN